APRLRADAVVNVEQASRIVFLLDLGKTRVIAPPKRLLPSAFEVAGLVHIRSRIRRQSPERLHASAESLCRRAAFGNRWLMAGNPWIWGLLAVRGNHQRESREHGGIGRGIACRRDRFGRCAA